MCDVPDLTPTAGHRGTACEAVVEAPEVPAAWQYTERVVNEYVRSTFPSVSEAAAAYPSATFVELQLVVDVGDRQGAIVEQDGALAGGCPTARIGEVEAAVTLAPEQDPLPYAGNAPGRAGSAVSGAATARLVSP